MPEMKEFLKKIMNYLPFGVTRNQVYDLLTVRIMRNHLDKDSNCIDVGVLDGEILDKFLKIAPKGKHFGFEPIPQKFEKLQRKYSNNPQVSIYNTALGNENGRTSFNYVTSNPSYSGIRKRRYDRPDEQDTSIEVNIQKLDSFLDELPLISMIKIDVEGAEYLVLEGASNLLKRDKPLLVFEHGEGGTDAYGIGPEQMFALLSSINYQVFLMRDWLKQAAPLSEKEFIRQFNQNLNYYFVAEATN